MAQYSEHLVGTRPGSRTSGSERVRGHRVYLQDSGSREVRWTLDGEIARDGLHTASLIPVEPRPLWPYALLALLTTALVATTGLYLNGVLGTTPSIARTAPLPLERTDVALEQKLRSEALANARFATFRLDTRPGRSLPPSTETSHAIYRPEPRASYPRARTALVSARPRPSFGGSADMVSMLDRIAVQTRTALGVPEPGSEGITDVPNPYASEVSDVEVSSEPNSVDNPY